MNLLAVRDCGLMTTMLVIGIKESATVNSAISSWPLRSYHFSLIVGSSVSDHITTANWHPFIPPNTGEWGTYGLSGIVRGAGHVFFAYIGFDAVSTAAQEAKNPQRDLPIGILGSLVVCTLLLYIVSAVLVGMVPYSQLNVPAPMAYALDMCHAGALGTNFCERGRGAWTGLRDARDVARPVARVLLDVTRWTAAAIGRRPCIPVPHTVISTIFTGLAVHLSDRHPALAVTGTSW